MELRVLRYFLAVVREESIVGAADVLHLTQPTLSRQLQELEKELGATLFIRGNRSQKLSLTEKGMLLRQRAEELIELADKTEQEMLCHDSPVSGKVIIGGGESDAMRLVAAAANRLKEECPNIHYQLFSGNAEDVKERLDKGLLDFGLFIEPTDLQKYECLRLPVVDSWGLLLRKDSPMAGKSAVTPQDLLEIPLLVSRQQQVAQFFESWSGVGEARLNIVASYNLIYNAALMVEEGFGNALCLDKLINTSGSSKLCFIPMEPRMYVHLDFAWKKHQVLSKAAQVFLEAVRVEAASF